MQNGSYVRNRYFSVNKEPTFEIYEKKEIGKKDWRLPYRKASFKVSSHFRSKPKCLIRPAWTHSLNLMLTDLLPKSSPYVPKIIQYCVNRVEEELVASRISINEYIVKMDFNHPSVNLIRHHIFNQNKDSSSFDDLDDLPISSIINIMKIIMFLLKRKPLTISRKPLAKIIEQPLSDKYHRPNLKIKPIILDLCLKLSKSCMDTLSFMMIHIIHFWKYDYAPTPAKIQLAEVFGSLLITFELEELTTDDSTKSPESALLEIILEVCDYHFWYQLSHHNVLPLFKHIKTESSQNRTQIIDRPIHLSPISYFISQPKKMFSESSEEIEPRWF